MENGELEIGVSIGNFSILHFQFSITILTCPK